MDSQTIIQQAKDLRNRLQGYGHDLENNPRGGGAKAQVCEFLRVYSGPKSSFLIQAEEASGYDSYLVAGLTAVMDSFIEYLESGLQTGISPKRQAEIDVVLDLLDQAFSLLENNKYHPASVAVLVGACLEEFLRNWLEAEGLSISGSNPGIDAYAKSLKSAELLSKQDVKDITAWSGIRNHAAHGEWEKVQDRDRVRLMLEGVNLFMRQRSGIGSMSSQVTA